MIKIDIRNTNDSLLSNMFRIIQCEARRLNVPEEKCNMAVLRITGPMWRFPMHYDAGHQIVIHLQGEKRWYWISNGTQKSLIAHPGDVLFIPAGTWHATQNESTSVMMNYGWVCEDSFRLSEAFGRDYPKRMHVVLNTGDK